MVKQERLDELYNAALKVFSEFGYKKATVEDIATEMGLTKGAIYQYVESKKKLYYEAVRYALLNWQQTVYTAMKKEEDTKEKFYVLCRKSFAYIEKDKVLKQILINDPSIFPMSFKDDPYKDINDKSMEYIKRTLERGIEEKVFKPVNVEVVTKVLYMMYKMLIIEAYVKEQDFESVVEICIDMVTLGLIND